MEEDLKKNKMEENLKKMIMEDTSICFENQREP
jgi:hypothetical protein